MNNDEITPTQFLAMMRRERDDRIDEAHDCISTGDEDAARTECELVGALNHAIDLYKGVYELD